MYYGSCNNSDEHKHEGREDFERRGRYGYDMEKYHDYSSDCNRAYSDGFDEARRNEDRRREEREEQERQEQREMRQARERREMLSQQEEYFWAEQYYNPDSEYEKQIEQHINQHDTEPTDDLPF